MIVVINKELGMCMRKKVIDVTEKEEEKYRTKVKNFYKKNKVMINSIAGTTFVVGGISAVIIAKFLNENDQILQKNDLLSVENLKLKKVIDELEVLCEVKDNYYRNLASDALRSGSSEGGRALREWQIQSGKNNL
ncbi:hypothetical protein [Lactococcus garvieae]|uniref:hypothetical protein n=1 Tax=Lactococcus garvieae TaxID=1363 RepID=UPI002549F7AD|nr:hypothetical protein [Lactococcus garvieae]